MRTQKIILLVWSVFFCVIVNAKNLGTFGQTYPVIEQNFLTFVKEKLTAWMKTGAYRQLQTTEVNTVKNHLHVINHHLTTTDAPNVYFIDPTKSIDPAFFPNTPTGLINPFNRITYRKTLVFIDADDEKQMHWFQEFSTNKTMIKLILVGGGVLETQQTLDRRVFVDQGDKLTDYFNLTHVPVVINEDQTKKQWRVKEIRVD